MVTDLDRKQHIKLSMIERQWLCEQVGATMHQARSDVLSLTRPQIAEELEIPSSSYAEIEEGRRDPGLVFMYRFRELSGYPISHYTGDPVQRAGLEGELTHELLRYFSKMPQHQQEMFIGIGRCLTEGIA